MRTFRTLLYADIAVSLTLIVFILARSTVIEQKPLGVITLPLLLMLMLNTALCYVSVRAVNRGSTRTVSRIWLFALTLFVFYVVGDIVSGYFIIPPRDMEEMYTGDKYVHHRHDPYKSIRIFNPYDFDVRIKLNNLGFRGEDVPGEKDPSEFRIVMLGDSFTLGTGVAEEDAFWRLLEERLNGLNGHRFRVISTGVSSYSPILEYMTLKRNIDALKPDLVIMNFDMSDLLNEYAYRKIAVLGKGGEPESVSGIEEYQEAKTSISKKAADWMYGHLFATTALVELYREHIAGEPRLEEIDVEDAVTRERASMLEHTLADPDYEDFDGIMTGIEDSILRTKALCESYGCGFILTTYPYGHQVGPDEWVPGRYRYLESAEFELSDRTVDELARFSAASSIPFLNTFPGFRDYHGGMKLYFSHDPHWTPEGHELMADALYGYLKPYLANHYGLKD
jgi:lysophospholipase L1-like esterase